MADPQAPAPTTTGTDNGALDPEAVALAKAIGRQESHGDPDVINDSGHWGLYQYDKGTWAADAKAAGVDAPWGSATPDQQNQVAYTKIKALKDQGLDPGQIASQWYTGKPNLWNSNKPQKGGAPTPADYAKSVYGYYQQARDDPTFRMRPTGTPSPSSPATAGAPALAPAGGQPSAPGAGENPDDIVAPPLNPDTDMTQPGEPGAGEAVPAGAAPQAGPAGGDVEGAARQVGASDQSPGGSIPVALEGLSQGIPGAPYLQAAASYIAPGSGVPAGTPFADRVAAYRGLAQGYMQSHPATMLAGMATPAVGAMALSGGAAAPSELGIIGTALKGAKIGAGFGAANAAVEQGVGNAADAITGGNSAPSLVKSAADIGVGALGGAVGGLAGKALSAGGAAFLRTVDGLLGSGKILPPDVIRKVGTLIGMDPDDISTNLAQQRAMGLKPTIAGAMGEGAIPGMTKLAASNPAIGAAARQAARTDAGEAQAMGNPVLKGTTSLKQYVAQRNAQADADYGPLSTDTITLTPDEKSFLSSPIMEQAIGGPDARAGLAERIKNMQITGQDFDQIRKGIQRIYQGNHSTDARTAKDALMAIGDRNGPQWRQAGLNYQLNSRKVDAAEIGTNAWTKTNEPLDDWHTDFEGLPNGPAISKPLRDGFYQQMGTAMKVNPAATVDRIANDGNLASKMDVIFGKKASAGMRAQMQAQQQVNEHLAAMAPGLSQGAIEEGSTAALHRTMAIAEVASLNPVGVVYHMGMAYARGAARKGLQLTPPEQATVNKMLFSKDPKDQATAITQLKAVRNYWGAQDQLTKQTAAAVAQAARGAGSAAINQQ